MPFAGMHGKTTLVRYRAARTIAENGFQFNKLLIPEK
jgi:hypothetical protein